MRIVDPTGLARLERAVRLGRLRQAEALPDLDLDLARADRVEQLAADSLQLVAVAI